MNQNSRTKNSVINIIVSFGYQLFIVLMTFLTRRIFIETLGIEYLGISGLFTNIIEILSLAELGIGSAMSFCMYKEIANNNKEKLKALSTYFKTLYNRIAIIVLVIGLALMPFLKYLIKIEAEIPNIELCYLISLINTVLSYLFVYKTTIVYADQNDYKLKVVSSLVEILKYILQIVALVVLRNYLLFLLVQIICSLVNNFARSKLAEKMYPFIREKKELEINEKKEVWDNIKPMFTYKLAGVALNNTDNILTSLLVSTTMVGIYSNYTMIFNKIYMFISLFFSSIVASVGNLNVTSNDEKKYSIYRILNFLSFWMYCFAVVGIFFLAEEIILMMSGTGLFVLQESILIISLINFYMRGMIDSTGIFRQTTGLFRMTQKFVILCAVLNLILSIILGKFFGLFGILLATCFARMFSTWWYEPYILYKNFFKKSPIEYFKTQGIRVLICIIIIIFMYPIMNNITLPNLYLRIAIKFIICCIIPNIILFLLYRDREEFQFLYIKIKSIFNGIKEKVIFAKK